MVPEYQVIIKEPDVRGEQGVWEFKSWLVRHKYYSQYNVPRNLVGKLAFHTGRFAEIIPSLFAQESEGAVASATGVEIGVYQGGHAEQILANNPFVQLTAIDMYDLHASTGNTAYTTQAADKTARRMGDAEHAALAYQLASDRLRPFGSRAILRRADSAAAVKDFSNLDFAYIDGDHSYGGCLADVERWWETVRPGGWLAGHDFGVPRFGVSEAVIAFARKQQLPVVVNAASHGEWLIKKLG